MFTNGKLTHFVTVLHSFLMKLPQKERKGKKKKEKQRERKKNEGDKKEQLGPYIMYTTLGQR